MLQVDKRILIVDDEEVIGEDLSKGLFQHGYQCVVAQSAHGAEQALQQEEFSLMLLDIGLPDRSGLTVLSEFNRRYPDMAIVMLTGNTGLDAAVLAMREGAYDYVTEPVSLSLVALRVEKALERRSLRLEKTLDQLADDDVELEPAIQEQNPPVEQAGGERCAESTVEAHGTPNDVGVNFEVENADDSAIDFQLAASDFVITGERVLDEKLGGGLPCGSLTLVEGASSSGKSVLCQHLIYGP